MAGLIGSALIALFACGLLAFAIRSVLVILCGPCVDDEEESDLGDERPTAADRKVSIVVRLVGLVAVVVVLHDLYYFIDIAVLTVNYNTGAQLTQATNRGDSREYVRDSLTPQRWQHAIAGARPTRWALADEVAAINQANLELVDFLKGKGIENREHSTDWKEELLDEAVTALFRSDNWFARKLTDRSLNAHGAALCRMCLDRIEQYQSKGWILSRLPAEWFQQ